MDVTQKIYDCNYNLFVALGLGRVHSENKIKMLLYSIYCYFIRLVYIFLWIFDVWDAYLVRENSEKLVVNMCSTVVVSGTLMKLYIVNHKYDLLINMRENFKNYFMLPNIGRSEKDKKISKANASKFLIITKIIYAFTSPVILMYFTFPAIIYYIAEEKIYPLPLPGFFGKETPIYEIIYVAHSLLLIHFLFFTATIDILLCELLTRICENFEILTENINDQKRLHREYHESEESLRNNEVFKSMRKNIKHHQKILEQLDNINEIYSLSLFVQVTNGSLLASITLFNMILVSSCISVHLINTILYTGQATAILKSVPRV